MITIDNKFVPNDKVYWLASKPNGTWFLAEAIVWRIEARVWSDGETTYIYKICEIKPENIWPNGLELSPSGFATKYKKNAIRRMKRLNEKFKSCR